MRGQIYAMKICDRSTVAGAFSESLAAFNLIGSNMTAKKLAQSSNLTAVQLRGTLVVSADVQLRGCERPSIERSMLQVEPVGFAIFAIDPQDPHVRCSGEPRVVTAWSTPQHFGRELTDVNVRDASGDHSVKVRQVKLPTHAFDGGGGQPDPLSTGLTLRVAKELGLRSAVGYSRAYDLGEAVHNALANLPPGKPSDVADELSSFQIMEIGVEIGGIAGFDHLRVTVVALT